MVLFGKKFYFLGNVKTAFYRFGDVGIPNVTPTWKLSHKRILYSSSLIFSVLSLHSVPVPNFWFSPALPPYISSNSAFTLTPPPTDIYGFKR